MNVFIAGLGLIGGSFAKAFKRHTDHTVYGYDIDSAVADFALSRGAVDKIARLSDLGEADLVIVCLYPDATISFIRSNRNLFKPDAVICDACGVKRKIYNGIGDIVNREGSLRFVGAHPMAGREHSGFDYSEDELFKGASLIVTPDNADEGAVRLVCEAALGIGFKSCKLTDIDNHDKMIAYTSQLAHVLACSYVNDPLAIKHKGYSAGSFRDVTRVAYINDVMWSELFCDNSDALAEEIDVLISNLANMRDMIKAHNKEGLREALRHSREIKEKL